ncbi:hypothetical protein LPC08_05020 [Roseomonas sp. OT10]|uniref:hypothetical protein n=1 Tax=Roseomonas cutis TaxID=2897332 RepID=UPI001E4DE70A|nr:hypothetical protein [Roseomonas sp. OT10]UFN50003.1 hypothetical protein LPC08_05020 [Roseomonas sp. OT10]
MRSLVLALLLTTAPVIASAETAADRARRELDRGIQQDRFHDAARDARGDQRAAMPSRTEGLEADRAASTTSTMPSPAPALEGTGAAETVAPGMGSNIQR